MMEVLPRPDWAARTMARYGDLLTERVRRGILAPGLDQEFEALLVQKRLIEEAHA